MASSKQMEVAGDNHPSQHYNASRQRQTTGKSGKTYENMPR
jgi:hypothetical protein